MGFPGHGTRSAIEDYPFFFEPRHAAIAKSAEAAGPALEALDDEGEHDPLGAGRKAIAALARAGLLAHCVPAEFAPAVEAGATPAAGAASLDALALCVIREEIARASGLADAVFALQALGSYPVALAGSAALRRAYLPGIATGTRIAAFAMTEQEAGSDAAAISTSARRDGDTWVLDGQKIFISNAGIADGYVVFARSGEAGPKGLSAFFVDEATRISGTVSTTPTPLIAPHPIGSVRFDACRIPAANLLGREGDGLKIALTTLDLCRPTVGAAANGFSRRALAEAISRTKSRAQFGKPLSEEPGVQAMLANMATELDAARLLVFRAAWTKNHGAERITREAAEAKLFATEAAQRIVDSAVQLHGGLGVVRGVAVERLYREVRALRIYEGASEIQRLVIGRAVTRA
jgi:acyl-CoA dehydrogenase